MSAAVGTSCLCVLNPGHSDVRYTIQPILSLKRACRFVVGFILQSGLSVWPQPACNPGSCLQLGQRQLQQRKRVRHPRLCQQSLTPRSQQRPWRRSQLQRGRHLMTMIWT